MSGHNRPWIQSTPHTCKVLRKHPYIWEFMLETEHRRVKVAEFNDICRKFKQLSFSVGSFSVGWLGNLGFSQAPRIIEKNIDHHRPLANLSCILTPVARTRSILEPFVLFNCCPIMESRISTASSSAQQAPSQLLNVKWKEHLHIWVITYIAHRKDFGVTPCRLVG